jgi:NAD(P)-dependent dehydrogenase (short-subunit alcohol dehydrogenase family)
MMSGYSGRVVLVFGDSRGIGAAIVERLARRRRKRDDRRRIYPISVWGRRDWFRAADRLSSTSGFTAHTPAS